MLIVGAASLAVPLVLVALRRLDRGDGALPPWSPARVALSVSLAILGIVLCIVALS